MRVSTATPAPLMTAAEFLHDYGDAKGVELVKGHFVRHPMAGARHGKVGSRARQFLADYADQHHLERVFGLDTFIRTRIAPDSIRGADAAFLSCERWAKDRPLPDGPLESPPETGPRSHFAERSLERRASKGG